MSRGLGRLLAAAGAVVALHACFAIPPAREPIDSAAGLARDETVVVGRIELVPPLHKDEQRIRTLNAGAFENKVFLIADERHRVLTEEPKLEDYKGRIEAILGETFFVRSKSQPFYVVGGMLYLNVGQGGIDQAYLPGGLKASLKPGDRAVYIGTLQYHRNEFFEITNVKVVDDYRRANAEFKKKFGPRHSLRKALLTSVK